MTKVILLDVGHGNCAIVRSGRATAVIDCPTGSILLDTLRDLGVGIVETAIISHADKDHIAGILSLLTSRTIKVERIYVNPDSQKRTKIWEDFRVAAAVAEQTGDCDVVTSLSTTTPGTVPVGNATISVLSPSVALTLAGVGGKTTSGRAVTANTLSGVLRISVGGGAGLLLAADMDEVGLDEALAAQTNLGSDVLVFPHHGGLPGTADVDDFVAKIMKAVEPRTVVFSNGRGRHDNPRPEIVEPVRVSGCAIACTQLSTRCRAEPTSERDHLEPIRASGWKSGASCAGSMTFTLASEVERNPAGLRSHAAFIASEVTSPMCRGAAPLPTLEH